MYIQYTVIQTGKTRRDKSGAVEKEGRGGILGFWIPGRCNRPAGGR